MEQEHAGRLVVRGHGFSFWSLQNPPIFYGLMPQWRRFIHQYSATELSLCMFFYLRCIFVASREGYRHVDFFELGWPTSHALFPLWQNHLEVLHQGIIL